MFFIGHKPKYYREVKEYYSELVSLEYKFITLITFKEYSNPKFIKKGRLTICEDEIVPEKSLGFPTMIRLSESEINSHEDRNALAEKKFLEDENRQKTIDRILSKNQGREYSIKHYVEGFEIKRNYKGCEIKKYIPIY